MKIRESLSLKTAFLLVGIWFVVIITVLGLFRAFVVRSRPPAFARIVNHYSTYLLHDIGIPPNPDSMRRITRETGIRIAVLENGKLLYSTLVDIDQRQLLRHLKSRRFRFRYHVARQEGYTFVFRHPDSIRHHTPFLVMFLGAVSLLILTGYMILRHILRPVSELQHGIDEISSGNRRYEVPVRGKDELSSLARSFNEMNGTINSLIEVKDRLLIDIGHELKSPLARMKLALEFSDEASKNEIRADVAELETLVDTILTSFRLSFERNETVQSPFDLTDALHSVITRKRYPAGHFEITVPEGTVIMANRPMFEILTGNLIGNAVRYSDPGKRPVLVAAAERDGSVTLQVTDYGIGIAKEKIPFLCEPFYRVDRSRTRESGGMGLGLYICRNIADVHGWTLAVTSREAHYTTVTVSGIDVYKK